MAELDLNDIQGNILRAYNFPRAVYTFIAVPDVRRGRRLVRDILPHVTDASDWRSPPPVATNLALTCAGLRALGADPALVDTLPIAFSEPMVERAPRYLHDTGDSDPQHWDPDLRTGEAHMLVMLAAAEGSEGRPLRRALTRLDHLVRRAGARRVGPPQWVTRLDHQREHFGYADGYGQPAVEGVPRNWAGQGTPVRDTGAWEDIKAGEFILGQPDEAGERVSGPAAWLLRNGSYMVYRKLEQDVAQFRRAVAREAARYCAVTGIELERQAAFELLAAKLVGRWRDGVALELEARRDETGELEGRAKGRADNDFRYGEDRDGLVCPVGAHIRRANPRDLLGPDGRTARRHRIIRRGMPYGPPYGDGETAAAARGLIFICFNADLERQFEVVQGQWCADGDAFGLGADQDFLLGNAEAGKLTIEGRPPFLMPSCPQLVRTRGCVYLLMPGLAALERLSAPPEDHEQLEDVPAGEADATARVVGMVRAEMQGHYALSRPVRRGQHPKSHGCVLASFEVPPDVPDDLRHGLFVPGPAGETYRAWIRFSASHSTMRSDRLVDAQGMAIKVMGVAGEKVLRQERWATTQDFVMVDHPDFFLRDAVELANFGRAVEAPGPVPQPLRVLGFELPLGPGRGNLRELVILARTLAKRIANPLDVQYWTQTPYALGPYAVKYTARPLAAHGRTERPQRYDALLEALADTLKTPGADFCFELLAQRQADPRTMPVEDPTVRWSEADAPLRRVALIPIPHPDDVMSQARRNIGERLTFTPWHTRWDHRPLGGINRVRRAVYLQSSRFRHHHNDTVRREPGGTVPHAQRYEGASAPVSGSSSAAISK